MARELLPEPESPQKFANSADLQDLTIPSQQLRGFDGQDISLRKGAERGHNSASLVIGTKVRHPTAIHSLVTVTTHSAESEHPKHM